MLKFTRATILAILSLLSQVLFAQAQDISLIGRDTNIEITGTLLGFDGEFYRVATEFGELTVDGSAVTCDGPACPSLENYVAEIRFSGSAKMGAVLMPALIEAFALKEGYVTEREEAFGGTGFAMILRTRVDEKLIARFFFRIGNTDEGFADLLADEADIVMALREIRPEERNRARESGLGDLKQKNRSRVLALDAVVPIVSLGNPIDAISPNNLARTFGGEIGNWQALGGPDAPITLHLPQAGLGFEQAVSDQVMKPSSLNFSHEVSRYASLTDLSLAVSADEGGIGLSSFSNHRDAQTLDLQGPCGRKIMANRQTIKTEDWPLTAPMFLYIPARRLPAIVRDFLAFTRSPSAQLVIRRAGYVDQTPEEIPIDGQGRRLANAIEAAGGEIKLQELQRLAATLRQSARLTTSFRFEAGSVQLDAQSRSNVQQLARALEVGQYDARHLTFVGFSDGEGAARANREIALRRAEAVRNAVEAATIVKGLDRVTLSVDAFGEALPMACDDSPWGRQVNRRVEVWVR